MSAAGFTPIQLYRSTTASAVPTSGNLADGELAINTNDGKLYYKDSGGTVQLIASKAGASGDVVGPASATDNAVVRFDGTTGKLVQNSVVTIADSTGDVAGVGALTASGNLTLSGGTANGVLYLNGSKVATSGSALTFDGTNFATTGTITSGGSYNFNTTSGRDILWGTSSYTYITGNPGTGVMAFGIANSELMRLTSTGLGIGTSSPSNKLVVSNAGANGLEVNPASGVSSGAALNGYNRSTSAFTPLTYTALAHYFQVGASPGTAATLDSSGNLGLEVTPSAWNANYKALQVGAASLNNGANNRAELSWNFYRTTAPGDAYIISDYATRYTQFSGEHIWYTAPSGTAGNAITFTQAMTLTSGGALLVGQTAIKTSEVVRVGAGVQSSILLDNSGNTNGAIVGAYNDFAVLGVNRNPSTGVVYDATKRASAIGLIGSSTDSYIAFETATAVNTAPTERARITSVGNFKIGGTADRGTTEGDKQLVLFNGTAPVGTLTNGISLYSSSGEAYVMDAAGNATLFSPHDRDTNEWIFRSKHTPSGKVLKIDVERLLRFVNDHFGLDAVQEFIEP